MEYEITIGVTAIYKMTTTAEDEEELRSYVEGEADNYFNDWPDGKAVSVDISIEDVEEK